MTKEDKKALKELSEKMDAVMQHSQRLKYKIESIGVIIVIISITVIFKLFI